MPVACLRVKLVYQASMSYRALIVLSSLDSPFFNQGTPVLSIDRGSCIEMYLHWSWSSGQGTVGREDVGREVVDGMHTV